MHEVLVNRLGGQSLPRKSVVRLTDCPDMNLDVYRGRKTTIQQQQQLCRAYPIVFQRSLQTTFQSYGFRVEGTLKLSYHLIKLIFGYGNRSRYDGAKLLSLSPITQNKNINTIFKPEFTINSIM